MGGIEQELLPCPGERNSEGKQPGGQVSLSDVSELCSLDCF